MKELDLRDKKILFQLDLNSRISYSELAKKLNTSKEVVNYRINRLVERKYIDQFYTIINSGKLGFVAFKLYLNFQNINEETFANVLKYLKEHKMVFWLASTNGLYEMMVAVWARNHYDFNHNFLTGFLNKFSKYISEKETTISLDNNQINRKWFLPKTTERKITVVGGKPEIIPIDKIDYSILKIIANNSRKPYTEIAKKTNTTLQIVKYRIRRLEKEGIILHYKLGVDPKRYGREFVKTIISLKDITEERETQLINYCLELKPTLNVVRCIGPWDLEIEMEIENMEKYNQVMGDIREKFLDIVKSYKTAIIISEPKVTFIPHIEF